MALWTEVLVNLVKVTRIMRKSRLSSLHLFIIMFMFARGDLE